MSTLHLIGLGLAVVLFIYLIIALFFPERFT